MRSLSSFLLVVLLLSGGAISSAQTVEQSVETSIRSFCDLEFNGAQDPARRAEFTQFSDSRLGEIKKQMDGLSPYAFEWQTSPLDVVDSYKIDDVSVSGEKASVGVDYVVVAQRDSWNGTIHRVAKKTVHSTLLVKHFGSSWKVINPPYPKVSKTFLSTSYRGLFELPQTWYQQASKAQLLWLRTALDNILMLDSLDHAADN